MQVILNIQWEANGKAQPSLLGRGEAKGKGDYTEFLKIGHMLYT